MGSSRVTRQTHRLHNAVARDALSQSLDLSPGAMNDVDLNLLLALDALLADGSVTGAARRLGLSSSAMSRTLARLRAATGDPLLVRAGNVLVPTPRAIALRDRVGEIARHARVVLSPQTTEVDLAALASTFIVRANEGFIALFAASLITAVVQAAPHVRLRFAPKPVKDARQLREGKVDLDIGVLGSSGPEVRLQSIFRDGFVGAARAGHPLLSSPVTPASYAACQHVVTSRKGVFEGPVDSALAELGHMRAITAVVPGFPDAMRIARDSDLVAQVPRSFFCAEVASAAWLTDGLVSFDLPVPTPEIVISAMWHPRHDAEPAHRWLRDTVMTVCRRAFAG
jgi:DNA-binding transcriptional LysR family regulator